MMKYQNESGLPGRIFTRMAIVFLGCGAVFAATGVQAAQEPAAFEKVLTSSGWSWGETEAEIYFRPDHTGWMTGKAGRTFKWGVISPQTVKLTVTSSSDGKDRAGRQANLTFKPDGSAFEGTSFADRPVHGQRKAAVIPSPGDSSSPTAKAASTPAPVKPLPPSAPPKPQVSQIANFIEQVPTLVGWVLTPINVAVPGSVRDDAVHLKTALTTESALSPQAWRPVYGHAVSLVDLSVGILDERQGFSKKEGTLADSWNVRLGQLRPLIEGAVSQLRDNLKTAGSLPVYASSPGEAPKLAKLAPLTAAAVAPGAGAPAAAPHSTGLSVNPTWNGRRALDAVVQSLEVDDMGALFASAGAAKEDLRPHPKITMYPGITYLMPRTEAEKVIGGGQGISAMYKSRSPISCSGFPGGLTTYSYDAAFEFFNRTCLVCDKADQVVAVELVAQHAFRPPPQPMPRNWHTIDYANQEVKGKPSIHPLTQYPVIVRGFPAAYVAVAADNMQRTTAFFVPKPMIDLILLCVANAQKRP